MPLPKALGMYADVKQVFDVCLANGPLSVDFPTTAQALQFRQRAYYYRKLLHAKQLEALRLEIAMTSTPYDSIKLTIDKNDPLKVRVAEVYITGKITLDSGEPVPMQPLPSGLATPELAEDPLMLVAQQIAKELE